MRFSVWPDGRRSWVDLLTLARRAATTGWDGIWLSDEPEPAPECWTAAAALAAAVPDIRLGAVADVDRDRHPAVVAKLASTVDHISAGRVILGLTAASGPDDQARLDETCRVVTWLVERDRTTFEGRFYQLHHAPLDPKPCRRPLPLMVCGAASADIAARYATRWCITGTSEAETLGEQIGAVERRCQEIGRDPSEVSISAIVGADHIDATSADLGNLLARYRQAGVDEAIFPAPAADRFEALTRIITDIAPAVR